MKRAAVDAGRDPLGITLVAVSKTHPASLIREAAGYGVTDFGENYLQEALPKQDELAQLPLTWHFIGAIQSNKTRDIAERFAWAHGVDRLRIARRLSEQRPWHAPPLNICLQVELVPEPAKAGVSPAELPGLAAQVATLPRIRLRGLMCIPPPTQDRDLQSARFAQLAALQAQLNAQGLTLDTLSMGMSEDFEIAIRAGATMVRVGSAIFGAREPACTTSAN